MNVTKKLAQCALSICLATAALSPLGAETDVYGNEIIKDGDGNVTYQFWKSGTKVEEASSANSSAAASDVNFSLDAMFKSVFATLGSWLYSTKGGMIIILK